MWVEVVWIFFLLSIISLFFLGDARYRQKCFFKGPLNPNLPTKFMLNFSFDVVGGKLNLIVSVSNYSLGAETRTPKNSPHKCLIQILIILDILKQKLNDATLASLGKLKYSRWRPRWPPKG